MKYGIAFSNIMNFTTRDGLVSLARGAEAAGFESVWTVEHVIYPDGYESRYPYDESGKMAMDHDTPLPDPLIWLSFVAAATETLHLGTGILILPQRNPVVLAKTLGTLDSLSGGRLELGIGVGWLEEEFDALGVPFSGRGRRTDEYIEAMRALWDGNRAEYSGETVTFSDVSSNPKPVNGRVPIHFGGHSRAAAERAGRLGDGFFPGKGDIDELIDIMRQTAADAGRDPDGIEVTFGAPQSLSSDPVGAAEEMSAKGVHRLVVPSFLFLGNPEEDTAGFGERVIASTASV